MKTSLPFYVLFLLFSVVYNAAVQTAWAFDSNSVYYIRANGNDADDGTKLHPWKTLNRLEKAQLQPGDRVFLQGNATFSGTLRLHRITGNKEHPVIIQSDSKFKVIINANDSAAVILGDCAYVFISSLTAVGSGRKEGNTTDGIAIKNSSHVSVDNINVSGFQKSGLLIQNSEEVTAKNIQAHDNGFAGISVAGEYGDKLHCRNIRVVRCKAYNNPGDPANLDNHSGNGILAGFCTHVMIDSCVANNNGWDMPRKGNGPVGIWCYEADSVTIQHCISYENKTSQGGEDGGGFDFDGGVTNSVIQYCLSYRNQGSAFGIFQYDGASPWHDNVIRFCISEDDGNVSAAHANTYIWSSAHDSSRFTNLLFYNNTLYNNTGAAVAYSSESAHSNFRFYNNIFVAANELLKGDYAGDIFLANNWWSLQSGFKVDTLTSLTQWANQHNKEKWNDKLLGLNIKPSFKKSGYATLDDVTALSSFANYQLPASSSLRHTGIDWQRLFDVHTATVDFNGIKIKSPCIGACSK